MIGVKHSNPTLAGWFGTEVGIASVESKEMPKSLGVSLILLADAFPIFSILTAYVCMRAMYA